MAAQNKASSAQVAMERATAMGRRRSEKAAAWDRALAAANDPNGGYSPRGFEVAGPAQARPVDVLFAPAAPFSPADALVLCPFLLLRDGRCTRTYRTASAAPATPSAPAARKCSAATYRALMYRRTICYLFRTMRARSVVGGRGASGAFECVDLCIYECKN